MRRQPPRESLRPGAVALALTLAALLAASALAASGVPAIVLAPGDIVVVVPQFRQVVRVDPSTGAQTLIAEAGQMVTPLDVAVTGDRQLLVVDADAFGGSGGGLIRIDPADGSQAAAALSGGFVDPGAIDLEADGSAIVVDPASGGGRVFRVAPGSAVPSEIGRVGAPGSELGQPLGVRVAPDGRILVADGAVPALSNFGVVSIDPASLAQQVESASTPFLSGPALRMDVALDAGEDTYVAWTGDDMGTTTAVILRIDPVTGVPDLFPPFASGTLFNALTAERSGDFLTTSPITGLVRYDAMGVANPLSAFFNAFGVAVVLPACSDRFDNDGDGAADFPADAGCATPEDDDESGGTALPGLGPLGLGCLSLALAWAATRATRRPR